MIIHHWYKSVNRTSSLVQERQSYVVLLKSLEYRRQVIEARRHNRSFVRVVQHMLLVRLLLRVFVVAV